MDNHNFWNQNCPEITQKKEVLEQEINSTSVIYIGDKTYTNGTIVHVFKYFALSRRAYNRLIEDFELPSVRTLTRVTSKVKIIVTVHI